MSIRNTMIWIGSEATPGVMPANGTKYEVMVTEFDGKKTATVVQSKEITRGRFPGESSIVKPGCAASFKFKLRFDTAFLKLLFESLMASTFSSASVTSSTINVSGDQVGDSGDGLGGFLVGALVRIEHGTGPSYKVRRDRVVAVSPGAITLKTAVADADIVAGSPVTITQDNIRPGETFKTFWLLFKAKDGLFYQYNGLSLQSLALESGTDDVAFIKADATGYAEVEKSTDPISGFTLVPAPAADAYYMPRHSHDWWAGSDGISLQSFSASIKANVTEFFGVKQEGRGEPDLEDVVMEAAGRARFGNGEAYRKWTEYIREEITFGLGQDAEGAASGMAWKTWGRYGESNKPIGNTGGLYTDFKATTEGSPSQTYALEVDLV